MDPQAITNADWSRIGPLLKFLWLYLLFIIGFASSILLAHIVLPSLIATGDLPEIVRQRAEKLRPLLYLTALIALLGALAWMGNAVARAGLIAHIYERWWI
ncbi:MAG: hypothetical protein HY686_01925 [Chloroflexi bacterium]|nr:hypothetical protein [Chloroflexota bacterium]